MGIDPTASGSDFGAAPGCDPQKVEGPGLNKVHAERIGELFRDEYTKLVHYMVARTGSWPEARDIAAQAFVQVLEVRDPETVSFLKAYVYRAARNLAIDRAKITANRSRLNEFVRQELPETTPSPEPLLMQQERFEILERAIEALRPTRRMILVLRLWEELPYADIVARLASQGIMLNERTLNRWYAEALKELRQALLDAEELKNERLRRAGRQ